MKPRMYQGREPMCIGVESDSQSSRPLASKIPAPRSSDSRMIDEYDIRKRTPAISFAMAWNAPPSTRSVIGSTSTRSRSGGPGCFPSSYSSVDMIRPPRSSACATAAATARACADAPTSITMFPERSTWAPIPGGITVVESYWLTIAGPSSRFPALSAARS